MVNDVGTQFSYAKEYTGPPLPFNIPRAAPIDVSDIPLAVISDQTRDGLCLPVVKPLFPPIARQLDTTVSPTSVIERATSDELMSGELSTSGPFRSSGTLDPGTSSQLRLSQDDWSSASSEKTLKREKSSVASFMSLESEGEETTPVKHVENREEGKRDGKWRCYRCGKGNRFTDKEACIVCDCKYCGNCVLRSMGSMPEGRKCVGCIGYPIDESKRGKLGKGSKILRKLLNELEVRQIMNSEKNCEANQIRAQHVYVNGSPLSHDELTVLQTCNNPPKKLKPEAYWYDKVSGLWGKEGQKPSQIITHHLNVGGQLRADASNGNTKVFINGREITKVELRMLQLAGVQCAGFPHFWVNEDGSYLEEGQKNPKGFIWGKAGMKLVCALLSLPIPSKNIASNSEQFANNVNRTFPDYLERRSLLNLLLVGNRGSGTSTIFKQAKLRYKPFTEEEREQIKLTILSNIYGYLGILLEGRERFEEEGEKSVANQYSIGQRLKSFSDWLLKTMASGNVEAVFPAATREYAPLVEELWKAPAIQATYNRRSELELLPEIASYYLERVVEVLKVDYEPSDIDILYAEKVTSSNGLACFDFSFPQEDNNGDDQHDSFLRYQLIRVQSNCKWLEMFEDAGMVIFCVSLTEYDRHVSDANGELVNVMIQSRQYFESLVTHATFEQVSCLLLLTKYDAFDEKLERVPLTRCEWFEDFNPVASRDVGNGNGNASMGQVAFHYVAVKFKRLYEKLTGRKLFVAGVSGVDGESVNRALKYAREVVKWEEERHGFGLSESWFCGIEEEESCSI